MARILEILKPWGEVAADKPTPQHVAFLAKTLERFPPDAIISAFTKHFEKSKFYPHLSDLKPLLDPNVGRQRPLPHRTTTPRLLPAAPSLTDEDLENKWRGFIEASPNARIVEILVRGICLIGGLNELSFPGRLKKALRNVVGEEAWTSITTKFEHEQRMMKLTWRNA